MKTADTLAAVRATGAVVPRGIYRFSSSVMAWDRTGKQGNELAIFEAVTGTTRYVIDLVNSPFVGELFVRSDDPHDQERFRRRLRVRVLDRVAFIASPEDMIVTKLRWAHEAHRSKDREDIRNILAVRDAELDWAYLQRWPADHGTLTLLEEIRPSIPSM